LAGVKDVAASDAGTSDEIAKQRAVGLVASRALRGVIGLPLTRDISLLPIFPKVLHANIASPAIREDRAEGVIRAVSDADERAEDVK
jgi:hypothetical protein